MKENSKDNRVFLQRGLDFLFIIIQKNKGFIAKDVEI